MRVEGSRGARVRFEATQSLQIALPGRESVSEISEIYYSCLAGD